MTTMNICDAVTMETTKRGFHIFHISNGGGVGFTREQRILVKDEDVTWAFEEPEYEDSLEVHSRIIIPGEIEVIVVDRYYDCNGRDEYHILKVQNGEVVETLFTKSGLASEIDDSVGVGFYQTIARLADDGWIDVPLDNEDGEV